MDLLSTPERLRDALDNHRAGRLPQAEHDYRRVLEADPDHPDANRLLGILTFQLGRDDDAVRQFEKVIELGLDSAEVRVHLGKALERLGRGDQAFASFRQAIAIDPSHATAHNNLGITLRSRGQPNQAIASYTQAILLQPDYAAAHYNLANALRDLFRFAEAAASYRRSLAINPGFVAAHCNLGAALKDAGDYEAAMESYRAALAIEPELAECHYNLGLAQHDVGRLDEAEASYHRALRINPDYADAHFSLALTLLLRGDYSNGWEEYEWRWRQEERARLKRQFAEPQWDGTSLPGKSILLHTEQGDGDTIQLIRYVSLVASFGGKIIVECPPALRGLLSTVPGIDVLIAKGEEIPPFDVQASLLSLPYIVGTALETIPGDVPYLHADSDLEVAPRHIDPERTNLGFVWAGSPTHKKDRQRSTQLEFFLELASLPGLALHSLQVGDRRNDLRGVAAAEHVTDLGGCLANYAHTAAMIAHLDLVITVDTSVAHLAGAMAAPVWVLLPYAPDFRWMLGRSDSPWYPTMKLFRQKTIGDWRGVFEEVKASLGSFSH